MKIAVYTICKNEAQFLDRWLNSAKDADLILVTDTGSTDNTYYQLKCKRNSNRKLVFNQVILDPWRFEDARNFSLMSLPTDIDVCICLDMDEVLLPNWRERVEDAMSSPEVDRLRYNYVWSWDKDGNPAVTYFADKIHRRKGFRWVNPVHEVLVKDARLGDEVQKFINDTLIEHHPDNTKSRSSYLELLNLAVKENPYNDRNAHYYARELMFKGSHQEAIKEFERHLALPTATWDAERAASLRYIGDCYWELANYDEAISYFGKAIEEAPYEREGYVSLAQAYRATGNWIGVRDNCYKALRITDKHNSYICQPHAWSNWPQEMLDEALKRLEDSSDCKA